MTTAKPTGKQWSVEAVETMLLAQGIALAPGRAERLARGYQALLETSATDPLLARLEFDAVPTAFVLAMQKCR